MGCRLIRPGTTPDWIMYDRPVRRIGLPGCINHQPFYYLPPMDDAMHHLVFVSHATGRPEVYLEVQQDRSIVQLTQHPDIGEWSVHPSHDSRFIYYTAASDPAGRPDPALWRVACDDGRVEKVAGLPCRSLRGAGPVAEGMGTISISGSDAWALVPVKQADGFELLRIHLDSGESSSLAHRDVICHPQFHPDDERWLRFGGDFRERIWVMRSDGKDCRLAYRRRPHPDGRHWEWIVHEVWRPGSMEIIAVEWPHGCIGIDVATDTVRRVCSFNAWHPSINRQGTWMAGDTVFPDRGIVGFDPRPGMEGKEIPLVESRAANCGDHWDTDYCPYDEGPRRIYAPQHTHPHPAFAPDGKRLFFTSGNESETWIGEVAVS